MAQSYVQVPADSVGKKVDTFETTTAVQHRQAVVIGDPATDANVVPISSRLRLPVELEQLLDYDTGGGTATTSIVGIALPASGGPVAGGTSTNPIRTDPTGSTTQPVSGPLTDTQLRASAVPVSAASLPLPSGASTEATLSSIKTAVEIIDNFISGSKGLVTEDNSAAALTALQLIDNIVSGSGVNISQINGVTTLMGSGVMGTGSLRVTIASNNDALAVTVASVPSHPVTNAGTFVVQENGAALTALQLIDNAVSGAGFNITQLGGASVPIGAGLEATAVRVTLPTDGTGKVTAVSATAANLKAEVTIAAAQTLATVTAVTAITNALPAGTNNIGDVDVLSLPVIPAGTNLIGRVSASLETNTIYDGTTALTPKYAIIQESSSGNNAVVAAVTSKKIRVLAYNFIANGTVNAKFQSDGAGSPVDLTGLKYCVANMGISASFNPVGWFESASGKSLDLNLSAAIAVGGELVYVEV